MACLGWDLPGFLFPPAGTSKRLLILAIASADGSSSSSSICTAMAAWVTIHSTTQAAHSPTGACSPCSRMNPFSCHADLPTDAALLVALPLVPSCPSPKALARPRHIYRPQHHPGPAGIACTKQRGMTHAHCTSVCIALHECLHCSVPVHCIQVLRQCFFLLLGMRPRPILHRECHELRQSVTIINANNFITTAS